MAKTSSKSSTLSLDAAVQRYAELDVRFTDAELDLAKRRTDQGDPVDVLDGILSERVGPARASEQNYPSVDTVNGDMTTTTTTEPTPTSEPTPDTYPTSEDTDNPKVVEL
jgi:hypothetical protein